MTIHVGTCGFPISRRKYFEEFTTVELQDTFYNKPDPGKLSNLRREVPEHFIFNMKAWQAITHPPTMPTWRRAKMLVAINKIDIVGKKRLELVAKAVKSVFKGEVYYMSALKGVGVKEVLDAAIRLAEGYP